MATNKKHIAVYLDPLVEQALTAFCEEKGLVSKKGCMYSTGVNAVLAEFFGIADTHSTNLETSLSSKTLAALSNIRAAMSNIPSLDTIQSAVRSANNIAAMSNIPSLDAIQSAVRSANNIAAMSNIPSFDVIQSAVRSANNIAAMSNIPSSDAIQSMTRSANNLAAMSNIPSSDAIQSMTRSVSNLAAMSKIPSSDVIQSMTRSVSNIQSAISNIDTLASSISAPDASNILPQSIGLELFPETTRVSDVEVDLLIQELEAIRAENQRLQTELGKSDSEKESLNQELAQVRSQLEAERADRQEIEAELSELKQNSAPAATLSENLTPDAPMVLNQVRAKRKKLKIDLEDVKAILKILASSAKKIEDE